MTEADLDRVVEGIIVCGAGHKAQGGKREEERELRKQD